jgi:hypothetical protein
MGKKRSATSVRVPVACNRNSNSLTTPKFPAPPRRPLNSSAFWVSVARISPVRRHQLEGADVVARQPVLPGEPTHPATEGERADPGVRHVALGGRQAVLLRGSIERAEERSALDPGAPPLRIDADAAHRGRSMAACASTPTSNHPQRTSLVDTTTALAPL